MFMPLSNLHYYSHCTLTKQQIIPLIQLLLSPKHWQSFDVGLLLRAFWMFWNAAGHCLALLNWLTLTEILLADSWYALLQVRWCVRFVCVFVCLVLVAIWRLASAASPPRLQKSLSNKSLVTFQSQINNVYIVYIETTLFFLIISSWDSLP